LYIVIRVSLDMGNVRCLLNENRGFIWSCPCPCPCPRSRILFRM